MMCIKGSVGRPQSRCHRLALPAGLVASCSLPAWGRGGIRERGWDKGTPELRLVFQGGMYWLVLLDDYSASFGLMVAVITTCLAVTRVYGERGHGRWSQAPHRGRAGVCTGFLVPRARVSSGGSWSGGGAAGTCGAAAGTVLLPPLCRHPELLPGYPHDAGLQAGPLLQGLLAVPVPGHAPGNRGWEGGLLAGDSGLRAGPLWAFSLVGLPWPIVDLCQG